MSCEQKRRVFHRQESIGDETFYVGEIDLAKPHIVHYDHPDMQTYASARIEADDEKITLCASGRVSEEQANGLLKELCEAIIKECQQIISQINGA